MDGLPTRIPTTIQTEIHPGAEQPDPAATREKLRKKLRDGKLDKRNVEVEVEENSLPSFEMFTPQGVEEVGINLKEMMPGLFGKRRRQQVTVAEAREIILQQEAEKLIDRQQLSREARERVEQGGMIFLDEIDKIAGREARGPDVSREGVQRDLLPIVEGSTVATKYGPVKTDHILFIAAGAFHVAKPSDLIPELQGRFPIRVGSGDSARPIPPTTALMRNGIKPKLTSQPSAITMLRAADIIRTGFRPIWSANPPVGNSNKAVVAP